MKRLLPAPLMSLTLWIVWLALNQSVAVGQLLLGAVLAVGVPLAVERSVAPHPRIRRPLAIARLALVVLRDIVTSNLVVARQILGRESALRSGFVRVPLALTDPYAIAALAGIVTMTPGTLTADVAPDGGHLVVHALHVTDADALVADIKARYEAPLREIFE